jgi:hypothetical protein
MGSSNSNEKRMCKVVTINKHKLTPNQRSDYDHRFKSPNSEKDLKDHIRRNSGNVFKDNEFNWTQQNDVRKVCLRNIIAHCLDLADVNELLKIAEYCTSIWEWESGVLGVAAEDPDEDDLNQLHDRLWARGIQSIRQYYDPFKSTSNGDIDWKESGNTLNIDINNNNISAKRFKKYYTKMKELCHEHDIKSITQWESFSGKTRFTLNMSS